MLKDAAVKTYLITDGSAAAETFPADRKRILKLIECAVRHGISMVQFREKHLTARRLFELSRDAAQIAKNSRTKLIINERADIALAAGADGVHLTSHSLPADVIRQNFPAGFLIGVSTHSRETALAAKARGADLITFGPIFPTLSKAPYGPPQGVEKLREIVDALNGFPVFALGGIGEENYRETIDAGAAGVAGISWLNDLVMAN
jgi:thiamine-phosphate pyrophosphorylase